ncbi:hypothetical protein [Paenibacillus odorifer]|uniref:hypothetical protein n=1 Tax=Paenibacillus odorifer TaxID=189426 RepID=UPI0015C33374|nr:hypothetical protein [Paenibacillus odorifer]
MEQLNPMAILYRSAIKLTLEAIVGEFSNERMVSTSPIGNPLKLNMRAIANKKKAFFALKMEVP